MDMHYAEQDVGTVADAIIAHIAQQGTEQRAAVIGLSGDLGAGKTTLVQAIAARLGVTEQVVSPTFVIAKYYKIHSDSVVQKTLIHIDAYRITDVDELHAIDWQGICADANNLIVVEWPENIAPVMPKGLYYFFITHTTEGRQITTKEFSYEKE